ncbi:MAG: hypothetical protein II394_02670, partial [Bacteroidales bacterium]|nr:hypothetical protein [Bacteroidales bacterium]
MKVKKVIDVKKQYVFPSNIAKVKYKDVFIIIAVNQANWIILENDSQVQFFDLLNEYTIEEALNIFKGSKRDASNVVTQIEARQFTNINRKRNNGMA